MKKITIISLFINIVICYGQELIEIPITQKQGYGHFSPILSKATFHETNNENPWVNTYINVPNAPKNWTEVKYGSIETDIYQSTYQNYISGNITSEWFEKLQNSWDWPDTSKLSKQPLKTKIAFASGKDSTGQLKLIIDVNNNHDFSDDISFTPLIIQPEEARNIDSFYLNNTFDVKYEINVNQNILTINAPMFICYVEGINAFMTNFPQYSIAKFNGETIAICSGGFSNLSYRNPNITLINDNLKTEDKISTGDLIEKGEFIKIKKSYYRNLGVDLDKNYLVLEKVDLSKETFPSPQIGFKSMDFEGDDFMTNEKILTEKLSGKYVLLDFWAVWCNPCIKEIPNLKKLYDQTDRNKFEIIGIVADSSPDELRALINKNQLSWPHIMSTEINNIKKIYGIVGYPTTFLINPDGIIIAKDLRGKELEDKVLELLKK